MILSIANLRKTKNYLKKNGIKNTVYASVERIYEKRNNKYEYELPSEEELERQRNHKWENAPKISIVVPAYETKPVFMEDLILSVADQTYTNYELIIADASSSNKVEKLVRELMEEFDHIIYHRLASNDGISENTNQGILLASGDYIGLLDHDDLLTPDALFEVASALQHNYQREVKPTLVYTDEDKTNTYLEVYYEPNRKGKFNPEMLLTNNYVCHFAVYREDVIKQLLLRKEYDGAQDYDLVLRTMKWTQDEYGQEWNRHICHIPKILYHWRCHEASTAENPESKMYAYEAGKRAVENYLKESRIDAKVTHLKHLGFYRVSFGEKLWELRPEIGVIGGPIYGKKTIYGREIAGGAMNGKKEVIYEGLPENFSGVMHRAVLQQNVDAVDIRNIEIREDLIPVFEDVTGINYDNRTSILDKMQQNGETEKIKKKSLDFCNKVKQRNIGILYDPEFGRMD